MTDDTRHGATRRRDRWAGRAVWAVVVVAMLLCGTGLGGDLMTWLGMGR